MVSYYNTFSRTRTPTTQTQQFSISSSSWSTFLRRLSLRDGFCVGLVVITTLCVAFSSTSEEPPIVLSLTRFPWAGSKRVLVTGFVPFAENKLNPSQLIATSLNNTCTNGVCYDALIVEVTPNGVARAASYINEKNYDGVLMLGLEDSAKGLKLEVVAQNIEQTSSGNGWANDIPQNATAAIANAPRMLATTAPLEHISLVRLKPSINVNELWSNDAGSFACNELYYRALHVVRIEKSSNERHHLTPALFVHVPTLDVASVQDMVEIVGNIARLMVR